MECTVGKIEIETLLFTVKTVLIIVGEDCSLVVVAVLKYPPIVLTHKSSIYASKTL